MTTYFLEHKSQFGIFEHNQDGKAGLRKSYNGQKTPKVYQSVQQEVGSIIEISQGEQKFRYVSGLLEGNRFFGFPSGYVLNDLKREINQKVNKVKAKVL